MLPVTAGAVTATDAEAPVMSHVPISRVSFHGGTAIELFPKRMKSQRIQ